MLSYYVPTVNWDEEVFGDYSNEVSPLPIPNREVKLICADGTGVKPGEYVVAFLEPRFLGIGAFLFLVPV